MLTFDFRGSTVYNDDELISRKMAIMKDNFIKAVYDSNLEALQKRLGTIDEIQAEKNRCVL